MKPTEYMLVIVCVLGLVVAATSQPVFGIAISILSGIAVWLSVDLKKSEGRERQAVQNYMHSVHNGSVIAELLGMAVSGKFSEGDMEVSVNSKRFQVNGATDAIQSDIRVIPMTEHGKAMLNLAARKHASLAGIKAAAGFNQPPIKTSHN